MSAAWQFLFFGIAVALFFIAAFFDNRPPGWTTLRYASLGWLSFVIPFAWNAAEAGGVFRG